MAVPADLPPIQGDSHQLAQLFTNLLINAYEAMEGSGAVVITGERLQLPETPDGEAREAVLVEVADTGPGMTADVADKIFDPFFTTKAKGSGLGLAIVRQVTVEHRGTVSAERAEGGGARFRLRLEAAK